MMPEEKPLSPHAHPKTVAPERWLVLACLCMLSLSNASIWISFPSIQNIMKPIYGRNQDDYDLLATIFAIVYLPLAPIGAVVVEKKGLRFALVVSSLINVAGAIIRSFSISSSGYTLALAGQTTCSVAQALFLAAPSKLSALWFPEEQRTTSTSLAVLANALGIAITMSAPAFVVDMPSARVFMYVELAACVLASLMIIFFCKQETRARGVAVSYNWHQSAMEMVRHCLNRDFVVLTIASGFGFGSYWSLSTILSQVLMAPDKDYPGWFVSGCGTTMVVVGLVGLFLVGFITDKTRAYRGILIAGFACGTVSLLALALIEIKSKWSGQFDFFSFLVIFMCALVGFSMSAVQPVSLEAGVEYTFPAPEEVSSGVLFWIANAMYIAEVHIADALVNPKTGDASNGLYVLVAAFFISTAVLAIFLSNRYKRMEAEHALANKNDDIFTE